MTYTVLKHQHGKNETDDISPGRGGYSTVLVNEEPADAIAWWEDTFGKDPTEFRPGKYPEVEGGEAWTVEEALTEEEARKHCGEITLDQGGIGSPMTRHYSWEELRGRLDVWVVQSAEDVPDEV